MHLTRAIVRPPGPTFASGLTHSGLGAPLLALAKQQHAAYCRALAECGLALTRLRPDARHPDSTFVEDTAVITGRGGLLTRPGAPSRLGEVGSMRRTLTRLLPGVGEMREPGTLDGGDVCQAAGQFFVGISERTDALGARQLCGWLSRLGYTATCIDIRGLPGLLHLNSGLSFLGGRRLAIVPVLAGHPALAGHECIELAPGEEYAANCLLVNDRVLIAAGYPRFAAALRGLGYSLLELDVSEFRKMDGGLSCLSLRF